MTEKQREAIESHRRQLLAKCGRMTETWIRALAERHGLNVLKRITTGTEKAGFCTFELSGPNAEVAWKEVHDNGTVDQIRGKFVYLRACDIDFKHYIGIESVYCVAPGVWPLAPKEGAA